MAKHPCRVDRVKVSAQEVIGVPSHIVTVFPAVVKERDNQPAILVLMISAAIVVGIWMVVSESTKTRSAGY